MLSEEGDIGALALSGDPVLDRPGEADPERRRRCRASSVPTPPPRRHRDGGRHRPGYRHHPSPRRFWTTVQHVRQRVAGEDMQVGARRGEVDRPPHRIAYPVPNTPRSAPERDAAACGREPERRGRIDAGVRRAPLRRSPAAPDRRRDQAGARITAWRAFSRIDGLAPPAMSVPSPHMHALRRACGAAETPHRRNTRSTRDNARCRALRAIRAASAVADEIAVREYRAPRQQPEALERRGVGDSVALQHEAMRPVALRTMRLYVAAGFLARAPRAAQQSRPCRRE